MQNQQETIAQLQQELRQARRRIAEQASSLPEDLPGGGNRLLSAFINVARALLAPVDLDGILKVLATEIVETGILRSLMVALVDESEHTVRVVQSLAHHDDGRFETSNEKVIGLTYDLDDANITAEVARTGQLAVIEEFDERFDERVDTTNRCRGKASFFIPVKYQDRVLAVLATGCQLDQKEEMLRRIDAMSPLVDQTAIALEHARLYLTMENRVTHRTAELSETNSRLRKEIAERGKAEDALRDSEVRFRRLSNASFEGIAITEKGLFVDVNDRFTAMFACERSDIVGTKVMAFVAPESRQLVIDRISSKNEDPYEHLALRSDGQTVPVEVRGRSIPFDGRELRVTAIRDITKRKRAEEELDRQRVRAVEADRLHALGEMAAGVAHELNQPLNGIRAFAEGITYGVEAGWEMSRDDLCGTAQSIVDQVDRMSGIIDHMREFSRDCSGADAVPFHLSETVDNALKLMGTQLRGHGISLHVGIPEGLPSCVGHPDQVEQILLNLITNARDAIDTRRETMRGETVSSIGCWEPAVRIEAALGDGPKDLVVEVSDTGGGIPDEVLPKIFDPFLSTKEVGKGTGLGLSISRGIAERNGGSLLVRNRPAEGATFVLSLPVTA